jgi:hypothetical protein
MYIQTVTLSQNLAAITHLWHAQWIMNSALPEAVIVFFVQVFFCHRLWVGIFLPLRRKILQSELVPRDYLIMCTLASSP